jgi:hypothetical protein
MRFVRRDVRGLIAHQKNGYGASYRHHRVLQRRSRLRFDFREIFGVVRFSTFATKSAMNRHGAPERRSKENRPRAASQKVDVGWLPTEFGKLAFFSDALYFSELLIELNTVFRLLPSPLTAAMIASEIPAAIKPYSMGSRATFVGEELCKNRIHVSSFGFRENLRREDRF